MEQVLMPLSSNSKIPGRLGEIDATASGVSLKAVRGLEGFRLIRDSWGALAERLAHHEHFFHRPEWYQSYLETLEEHPGAVTFHLVYRGDVLIALLPLRVALRRLGPLPFRVWEIPHHNHMLLSDFICDTGETEASTLDIIVQHLRSSALRDWDVILLHHVPEDSCVERCLARRSPDRLIRDIVYRCNFLEYSSHEEFLAAISKNFRGNLRKARSKLAKTPEAKFLFVREKDQLHQAFEWFCRVEASGWKGSQGTSTAIQLDPRLRAFYSALIDNLGARDCCEINLLMLEDTCVAGQFCLRSTGATYVLKIGYNEAHGELAPGNMLLERLIQRLASPEQPVKRINLITGMQWHEDWKPRSEKVSNLWIYNHTARATLLYRLALHRRTLRAALKAHNLNGL
jgi:CelD/BcsL family acetyltransferase involved in cellulose biosynthesis